mgnify:CR=1 FL=1
MIDTDKYEGHTEGVWTDYNVHSVGVKGDANHSNHRIAIMDLKPEADVKQAEHIANRKLIADAPLLLAEVKRLREEIERIAGITNGYVGPTKAWAEHITKDLLAVIE